MKYTREKKGYSLHQLPKAYPLNSQQKKLKKIAEECGIHKGMTKKELQRKMIECVGPKMRISKHHSPYVISEEQQERIVEQFKEIEILEKTIPTSERVKKEFEEVKY